LNSEKEEALKEAFYADCSDVDVEFAKSQLVPQAAAPLATPLRKANLATLLLAILYSTVIIY
jgi:hypothetical protein